MNLYKRILLKMSGEAISGDQGFGIDFKYIRSCALSIKKVLESGIQISIVVGGGNYFRGRTLVNSGFNRRHSDYVGMLGTVMNALILQGCLEEIGVPTRVQSAITMSQIAEPYIPLRAIRHMEKGRVVIFASGLGCPFFSTDTCAAQRAMEVDVDILLMAKSVDGVYDKDPNLYKDAKRFSYISYMDFIKMDLNVIDKSAISICKEGSMEIRVFDMNQENGLYDILFNSSSIGTVIK